MHGEWGGGKRKLDRLSINTQGRMASSYLTGRLLPSGTCQLGGVLSIPGPNAIADPWSILKMVALRTCQIYVNSESAFAN